jgi:hypothetical protein
MPYTRHVAAGSRHSKAASRESESHSNNKAERPEAVRQDVADRDNVWRKARRFRDEWRQQRYACLKQ